MYRLLVRALVALFLFAAASPARAEDQALGPKDTMTTRILKITVIGSTPKQPLPHPVLRYWMPYATAFTCTEAAMEIDLQTIDAFAQRKLGKKAAVLGVSRECEAAGPSI